MNPCALCQAQRVRAKVRTIKKAQEDGYNNEQIAVKLMRFRVVNRGRYRAFGLPVCRKHLREVTGT